MCPGVVSISSSALNACSLSSSDSDHTGNRVSGSVADSPDGPGRWGLAAGRADGPGSWGLAADSPDGPGC